MIIFSGIIASIPKMFSTIYEDFFVNVRSGELTRSYIIVALLIVVGLAIVFFTTFVQQAEYQIPIQYTKLVQGAPTSSYLPLKVNPAGVIPVIFASSITTIPSTILPFFSKVTWLSHLQGLLSYNTPSGMITYAILIILFSFFYTFVQVNPEKLLKIFKRMGLTFLVFVQVVRLKSTCLHCLRDWQQSGLYFSRLFHWLQLRLNSLCTLQARSRLVVHLS